VGVEINTSIQTLLLDERPDFIPKIGKDKILHQRFNPKIL